MSNGIDTTRRAHPRWQSHGQIHIINNRPRQDLLIRLGLLDSIRRLAQNRRHFTPRVRRRDTDMRHPRAETNRLAQANCAASANGDHRVRAFLLGVLDRIVRDVRGRVHGGIGEDAGDLAVQHALDSLGLVGLLWCRENQRLFEVETGYLIRQFLDGAAAKDHPARVGVVLEGVHCILCSSLVIVWCGSRGASLLLYKPQIDHHE